MLLEKLDRAYLFCFCVHKGTYAQQNGLLSMWREYGEEGGYAIVFNREKVDEYLKEMDKQESNYMAASLLKKITYLRKKDSKIPIPADIRKDSDQLKKLLINRLIPLYWKQSPNEMDEAQEMEAYQAVLRLIIFIKHRSFYEEREFRLCLWPRLKKHLPPKDKQFAVESKIRKRGSAIISYVEFPIVLKGVLKEIIIGPQRDMETKQKFLKNYLQSQGLSKIKVRASDIPYLPR